MVESGMLWVESGPFMGTTQSRWMVQMGYEGWIPTGFVIALHWGGRRDERKARKTTIDQRDHNRDVWYCTITMVLCMVCLYHPKTTPHGTRTPGTEAERYSHPASQTDSQAQTGTGPLLLRQAQTLSYTADGTNHRPPRSPV